MNEDSKKIKIAQSILDLLAPRRDVCSEQQPNGKYLQLKQKLTLELVLRHLNKEDTFGGYLITDGDKVKVLIFDIDTKTRPDVISKIKMFLMYCGISCYVENTGGVGYHIWVFFDKPISAVKARKLGQLAVDQANVSLKIEIFPKQDKVEKGKFGNSIRLFLGKHKKT